MSLMQIVQSVSEPSENTTTLAIAKVIAELCQYTNHASNFFLYTLTGRVFRREFVRLFFPIRFSTGNGTTAAARIGFNEHANFARQILRPPSRHTSFCSIENNQRHSYRTSQRLTTKSLKQNNNQSITRHNQTYAIKSSLLFNNKGPLTVKQHHIQNGRKSSMPTVQNFDNKGTLHTLLNIINQSKEHEQLSDESLLFVNILKPKRQSSSI